MQKKSNGLLDRLKGILGLSSKEDPTAIKRDLTAAYESMEARTWVTPAVEISLNAAVYEPFKGMPDLCGPRISPQGVSEFAAMLNRQDPILDYLTGPQDQVPFLDALRKDCRKGHDLVATVLKRTYVEIQNAPPEVLVKALPNRAVQALLISNGAGFLILDALENKVPEQTTNVLSTRTAVKGFLENGDGDKFLDKVRQLSSKDRVKIITTDCFMSTMGNVRRTSEALALIDGLDPDDRKFVTTETSALSELLYYCRSHNSKVDAKKVRDFVMREPSGSAAQAALLATRNLVSSLAEVGYREDMMAAIRQQPPERKGPILAAGVMFLVKDETADEIMQWSQEQPIEWQTAIMRKYGFVYAMARHGKQQEAFDMLQKQPFLERYRILMGMRNTPASSDAFTPKQLTVLYAWGHPQASDAMAQYQREKEAIKAGTMAIPNPLLSALESNSASQNGSRLATLTT